MQVSTSTWLSRMSCAIASGSMMSSAVAITTVMPLESGMNSSSTETSKVSAAMARLTEPWRV